APAAIADSSPNLFAELQVFVNAPDAYLVFSVQPLRRNALDSSKNSSIRDSDGMDFDQSHDPLLGEYGKAPLHGSCFSVEFFAHEAHNTQFRADDRRKW